MNQNLMCPNEGDKLINTFVADCNSFNENPSDSQWEKTQESFLNFVEYIQLNPMPTRFYNLSTEEICNFVELCEELDSDDEMRDAMNSLLYLVTKIK